MTGNADVVVVGGGPSGATCAALLAQRGFRVVLVIDSRQRLGWSDVLSPEAAIALERVGFPTATLQTVARPCMGVVDGWLPGPRAYIDFRLLRFRCGWVVERGAFDKSLVGFAAECGVSVYHSPFRAKLAHLPQSINSSVTVQIDGGGGYYMAKFVVDATGSAGQLLPPNDSRRIRYDRLVAVRIALDSALKPTDWMHLSTSSSGWWYTLPKINDRAQGIFMTDSDLLPRSQIALQRHLAMEFQEAFPCQRSAPVFLEPVTLRDARTTCRQCLWTGRWLPIGDASVSIDPLTGGGLQRAIDSAEVGAELVSDFLTSGCFKRLETNAIDSLHAFNAIIGKLYRYYMMAIDNTPNLIGPFWRRRRSISGFQGFALGCVIERVVDLWLDL